MNTSHDRTRHDRTRHGRTSCSPGGVARLAGAGLALLLGAVACTSAPGPAPTATTLAPHQRQPRVVCSAGAQSTSGITPHDTDAADDPTPTGATSTVIVAVDADGRPHLVTTEADQAPTTAAAVDASPGLEVVAIEPDIAISATESAPTAAASCDDPFRPQQWALDSLGVESIWETSVGADIDIAIVDTGVDGGHPDLVGRVAPGVSFVGTGGTAQTGAGDTDPNGHGTHVAGIAAAGAQDGVGIAGVAPFARILPVRVLDSTGAGSSSAVAAGITWAVDNGAEVINLSLGGSYSGAIATAVDYADSRGVVVVAATGNTGTANSVMYPAALATVIAVASHDSSGSLSPFSSRGPQVDVAAPGSSIVSAYPGAQWRLMQGTSMATPHVAGTVALMFGVDLFRSPEQVRALIRSSAVDAGTPGFDDGFGWGRLDAAAALGL